MAQLDSQGEMPFNYLIKSIEEDDLEPFFDELEEVKDRGVGFLPDRPAGWGRHQGLVRTSSDGVQGDLIKPGNVLW